MTDLVIKTAPAAEFTDRGCCFAHVYRRDGLLLVGEVEAVGLVPVAAGEVGHFYGHVAVEHGDCCPPRGESGACISP